MLKTDRVWYEDASAAENVSSVFYADVGLAVEAQLDFSLNHNVLPAAEAWGMEDGVYACGHCHRVFNGGQDTLVMDRLILTDPCGVDGQPVYEKAKDLIGINHRNACRVCAV